MLGACARPGGELHRRGDEIVACGRLFHTGAPVVLWTDPGGYDAYRTEKRFVPWAKAPWKPADGPGSPNRYGVRFAPKADGPAAEGGPEPVLTADEFERVRGGGWDLDLLREHVDQFVLHFDVCGVSRQCFRILHDVRGLSVQFMLDIDGTIYQTMDVKERAWHATSSNDRSVGVEIANIGAYGPGEKAPFEQWYRRDPAPCCNGTVGESTLRITVPDRLGDGGVRTPNFVGRPARSDMILGDIQGRQLRQYDFTPQQYDSLIKLTAALHRVFPKIELDYPRDESGKLVNGQLGKERLEAYRGVMGHYHIQKDKTDPGPAMQWDRVINGARRALCERALPPGDWINDPRISPPSGPAAASGETGK
jgi:N-acetylmuramoyl-L-alanine amidase